MKYAIQPVECEGNDLILRIQISICRTQSYENIDLVANKYLVKRKGILGQHGVHFDNSKTARKITPADYARFDRIICMDASNLRLIRRIIPSDPDSKIHLLMSYTGRSRDVADPWYTSDFETTFQDILEGCEAMLAARL